MNYFIRRNIINLVFPNRCPVCNKIINANDRFCQMCTNKLTMYTGNFEITGASEFFASLVYDKAVMPALFMLKNGECGNADYAFGEYLSDVLKEHDMQSKVDFIVPVPMTKQAFRKRGYNQAELISKVVSAEINIPVKSVLKKAHDTKEQKKLDRADRKLNVKNVFEIMEDVSGQRILVIDDICTTGSTLSEISLLLRRNGAENVFCASVMKVI